MTYSTMNYSMNTSCPVWCYCGRIGPAYGIEWLSCGPTCKPPTPTRKSLYWRTIDAIDEWAHDHGMSTVNGRSYPWWWRLTPFPTLCNYRDDRLLGKRP